MNNKQYQKAAAQNVVAMSIGLLVMMVVMVWALGSAFDDHFTRQDIMLCNSAQVSGNLEMLDRCQTFYKTNNPADIQEAK